MTSPAAQARRERNEKIVRLLQDGRTHSDIAATMGVSRALVTQVRKRQGLPTVTDWDIDDRIQAFEAGLACGLTARQAVQDAGWSTARSAVRSLYRFGRPVPEVLREAESAELQERRARR